MRIDPRDPDMLYLKAYFGLADSFPLDQLVTHNHEMNKIFFLSKAASDLLNSDKKLHQLNLINLGALAFQKNASKHGNTAECLYRLCQDGLANIVPFMSKRVVRTENLEGFKQMIMNRYIGIDELVLSTAEKETIEDLSPGCFVVQLALEGGKSESVAMHKCNRALSLMVGKENLFSLHQRFLSPEELETAKKMLN